MHMDGKLYKKKPSNNHLHPLFVKASRISNFKVWLTYVSDLEDHTISVIDREPIEYA